MNLNEQETKLLSDILGKQIGHTTTTGLLSSTMQSSGVIQDFPQFLTNAINNPEYFIEAHLQMISEFKFAYDAHPRIVRQSYVDTLTQNLNAWKQTHPDQA
jgi:hypothetical protein